MKIVIAGGRDFNNPQYMAEVMKFLSFSITEVVSGCQWSFDKETQTKYGADYLGEEWAKKNKISVKPFPADWVRLGRSAGPVRNGHMAEYADFLVAFWDGKSRGTQNMIQQMIDRKKPYVVFFY